MADIGILGGTFDPIHLGHLQMAQAALQQADLEQVMFMPSKRPPHKQDRDVTGEKQRAAMVRLAIKDIPGFVYSDVELRREGLTYTVETLRFLQQSAPDDVFYFIMGGDSLWQIEHWREPEEIMERVRLLAVCRGNVKGERMQEKARQLTKQYRAKIRLLQMPEMDVSSSEIRKRVRLGQDIRGMTPAAVEAYIYEQGLYRGQSR